MTQIVLYSYKHLRIMTHCRPFHYYSAKSTADDTSTTDAALCATGCVTCRSLFAQRRTTAQIRTILQANTMRALCGHHAHPHPPFQHRDAMLALPPICWVAGRKTMHLAAQNRLE